MGLQPRDFLHIPEQTSQVAQAAFPKGNNYMTMRDQVAIWYKDSDDADLFISHQGRPALSPGRLNLITIMQYAEGLSDRQTVEAVASRMDWKYALGLAKTHLQHLLIAAAINLARAVAWCQQIPLAKTRLSSFSALAPMASHN